MRRDPGKDPEAAEAPGEVKSKTRRKKEMLALQKLGVRLVGLPEAYLKTCGIPGELLDAVLAAKRIRSFQARRRQMQYIGVVMRGVDADLVARVIERFEKR
ncbi:MAG TPA: ribosome biogenesis factor YjgA [Deltaproteobacteria bacterium]|nr:ribosome biogenesis factor YjgA [Deltaproteobacteria bacterium]